MRNIQKTINNTAFNNAYLFVFLLVVYNTIITGNLLLSIITFLVHEETTAEILL